MATSKANLLINDKHDWKLKSAHKLKPATWLPLLKRNCDFAE